MSSCGAEPMKLVKAAAIALLGAVAAASAQAAAPQAAAPQTAAPKTLVPVEAPASTVTGTVDLGAEYPAMKGYVMTQTISAVAPGTGRALHSHAGRPEMVRVVSGTLTDARNGGPPTAYGPGSTLVNAGGTEHMWANMGSETVVLVTTSIRPPG
jgi:quercetin dioxygenase-like cupin family protein